VPFSFITNEDQPGTQISFQSVSLPICIGLYICVSSTPKPLLQLYPHPHKLPSVFIPITLYQSVLTFTQSVSVPTCVSMFLSSQSPTPKFPYQLAPQLHNVPFSFIQNEVYSAALISFQSVSVPICVGIYLGSSSSNPNSPNQLLPHPHKLPSLFSKYV